MVSVEFTAKSFFPICPEIKKMDSRRLMYFGNPRRSGLPTVRFDGTAIKSSAVKQTLRNKTARYQTKNTKRTCLDFLLHQI